MDSNALTLGEIAALLEGDLAGDAATEIHGVAGLDEAGPGQLSFLANRRYLLKLGTTRAAVVLIKRDLDASQIGEQVSTIAVGNPSLCFAKMVAHFSAPPIEMPPGVHPAAIVDPSASLGENVSIGAHAVIEGGARIGNRSVIHPQAYVGHHAVVGQNCVLHPNVVLRERVELGDRVAIHAGSVIGCDGYGYVFNEGRHEKIPQLGTVQICDDVEIGANCTIDRARFDRTVIGQGTKIDNLVHIGHNVQVGEHCLVIALVGIAGSSRLGDYCILAGQCGIDGHVTLGDGARVAGKSGVTKDVPPGGTVMGYLARPLRDWIRQDAALRKLPELIKQLAQLEEKVSRLEAQAKDDQASG